VPGGLVLGGSLVLLGALLEQPLVVVLGVVATLIESVRLVWQRAGASRVVYRRRFEHDRAVVGDEVPLTVSAWNRGRLPLAWVRAEDAVSRGLAVAERELVPSDDFGQALANAWTLAPSERVTRHFRVRALRRGVQAVGPARLAVGDLFAARAADLTVDGVERLIVRPRTVAVAGLEQRTRWAGSERARRGLSEHPTSYAGLRDYRPGDPVRRIHHRASARTGRLLVKRFDPAREREVLIALDIQTVEGPAWQPQYDDDLVEVLCVVAGSIARRLRADGAAVGLAVAGYSGAPRPMAILTPSAGAGQVPRILDTLARLGPFPSAPFGRLLGVLPRALRPGAEVVVLTTRDPASWLASLRRMGMSGFGVEVVAIGPGATQAAARARAAGIPARIARLDGGWADASGLVVA
jgi:uncharacterized protein (DUF58 family)